MTQREAFAILKSGVNVFLTGGPGSGKTYVLNEYIRFLKGRGVEVGVTASTGIAATHIGGFTIHSWAGMGIKRNVSDEEVKTIASNRRIAKRCNRAYALIIDEISMLDADRLDLVDRIARAARGSFEPFGGMQVILCGDFFQLPPVAKGGEPRPEFAYRAAAWNRMNPKICYLSEQYRQEDKEFIEVLNAIRNAAVNDVVVSRLWAKRIASLAQGRISKLYSHNVDVDQENIRELASLPGKEVRYEMEATGISAIIETLKNGCLAPEILSVKKGALVMFVKNNFEKGYVNGTLGTVTDFDEYGYPVITTFGGSNVIAAPATWGIEENGKALAEITQIPLRLAWAITIHKSQGMTLDAAEIDLSDAFEKGMGYVALSRVRSLDGIRLLGFNEIALQVSPEILAFDGELRKLSEETAKEFHLALKQANEQSCKQSRAYIGAEIRNPRSDLRPEQRWKQTLALVQEGKTIAEVASTRGRTAGTILKHLESLHKIGELETEKIIHLACGQESSLYEIHAAFRRLGGEKLKPIYDAFAGRYSYEIIRIARLLFSAESSDNKR